MATVAPPTIHNVLQDSTDKVLVATLTDAVGEADDGGWLFLGQFSQGISIEFEGIEATEVVQVYGYNGNEKPTDSDDHTQIGNDQTGVAGNDIVSVGSAPLWIKTKIDTWATGTITTRLVARKP